ncbi:DNA-invertase [Escherichia coli]|nr:DNA-invertase [Escherichia coli]
MLIGYVRVSTNDQNTDLQRNALNCAGCELIFEDKISGTKSDRPGLKKLLRTLSAGDTLVVWKLDRLGRSMRHLVVLVEELRERGINCKRLVRTVLIFTESSDQLSRATDRVPGLPASPGYVQ